MRIFDVLRRASDDPRARVAVLLGVVLFLTLAVVVFRATLGGTPGATIEAAPSPDDERTEVTAAEGRMLPRVPDQPEHRRTADAAPREVRGAWIQAFDGTLKSRDSIRNVVEEASAAGVNTLIVQVVRRQDAFYRSSVLPRATDPDLEADLDVLDEVIRHAEPAGIDVEAWIVVAPVWEAAYSALPRPQGWVYDEHGPNAPESQRWVSRSSSGTWGEYLDLALPEVQDHVTSIATEIAANYPVAAVHLDYIRYPGNEWGYHPRALERFRAETGRSDTPSESDAQWSQWRRDQVTSLVRRVDEAVEEASPGTRLTAATIAWGNGPGDMEAYRRTQTYTSVLQDWAGWAADGTVDAIYPMVYFQDSSHAQYFDRWVAFSAALAESSEVPIAIGVGAWLNPPGSVVGQLQRGAEATDGALVYSWQEPTSGSRAETITGVGRLWAQPAE